MLPQIIIATTCTLITLYGVFKKNRIFFNLGYFIYGLIVIASELSFFSANQESIHIATAALWMIQVSLALPNKLPYDGSKIAKALTDVSKLNQRLCSWICPGCKYLRLAIWRHLKTLLVWFGPRADQRGPNQPGLRYLI